MSEGAGFELDLGAHIAAAVGQGVSEALDGYSRRDRERRARLNGQIMPLNIDLQPIQIQGGAGQLDQPRLLGPAMGWTWQLDSMGAQGYSAGSVGVFLNSPNGTNLFNFTSAGALYQRHFRYMRYGERLIFVASGITGAPAVWVSGIAFMDALQGEVLL